jgi:hypothetical protein
MNSPDTQRPGRSRLAIGIILMLLGASLLLLNIGVNFPWQFWKYFPVPLIAFGLWGLVSPTSHLDRVGGLWLFAAGLYCLFGIFNLFGLGWHDMWPIFIVATGASVMLHGGKRKRGIE